jgi:hypothetical protein
MDTLGRDVTLSDVDGQTEIIAAKPHPLPLIRQVDVTKIIPLGAVDYRPRSKKLKPQAVKLPDDPRTPLSVKQASLRMAVSERKIYELCKLGLLKHTRNPIRILQSDIVAYQTKQRVDDPGLKHLR